jgi:exonuclease-1
MAMGQLDLAKKKMAEAFDISPDVAYRLILAMKEKKLPFIVAPYEADAQLAYLSRYNFVDIVITEDSDLLAFGAKSVLYKFDYRDYMGDEITLEQICQNKSPNLRDFNHCMFLSACILTGCDYLNQIRGVGPMGAFNLISRNKTGKAALRELRSTAKNIPVDYEENFIKAFLTFRFQRVYCPR